MGDVRFHRLPSSGRGKIGRAAGRGRGENSVGAGSLKKKKKEEVSETDHRAQRVIAWRISTTKVSQPTIITPYRSSIDRCSKSSTYCQYCSRLERHESI